MTSADEHRVVADRYLLIERLGSGGMGTVWRATDQLLERTVAVKELRVTGDSESMRTRMQRALREARAIARLSHPRVVDIYDLIEYEDRLWMVMELVDGTSLERHVAVHGPLCQKRVAEIGLQLLSAIEAVHEVGVLHRDIKPANVLVRRDGNVVLCDFGIAAFTDGERLTRTGGVVGSVEFMAPERLRHGEAVETPSDMFSFGVTLCVLVSGHSPFARASPFATLEAVAYEEPLIPPQAGPLQALLGRILRKEPESRPSPVEVFQELQHAAEPKEEPAARKPKAWGRPGPHRRAWFRWGVPAAIVVALGTTAGVVWSTSGDPSAPVLKGQVGWWPAHEKAGSVLGDAHRQHDAKLSGGTEWVSSPHGGGIHFDGTGYGQTDRRVVRTVGKDYSVAAWVRLQDSEKKNFNTAVSEDTGNNSAFYLQYSGVEQRFAFSAGDSRAVAHTPSRPQPDRWYHLTGVYRHESNTLQIYVDGTQEGSKTTLGPVAASGPLAIGRAQFHGQYRDLWHGDIADVRAFSRALSDSEVDSLGSRD